jgi:ATP-dependent Clp protease protease subunit
MSFFRRSESIQEEGNMSKKRKRDEQRGVRNGDWADEFFGPRIYSQGNEIHFTDDVHDDSINQLIRQFQKVLKNNWDTNNPLYLDREDSPPVITLFISSYGGNLDATYRWVDYVNLLKSSGKIQALVTVLTGFSASAGTIMAQQGDVRLMTSNAYAMIHELSSGYSGPFSKLKSETKFCEQLEKRIVKLFVEKTGLSEKEIEDFLLRDTWFSAEEYLENGFVDDIFENIHAKIKAINEGTEGDGTETEGTEGTESDEGSEAGSEEGKEGEDDEQSETEGTETEGTETGCKFTLVAGKNKGKLCGKSVKEGSEFCSRHKGKGSLVPPSGCKALTFPNSLPLGLLQLPRVGTPRPTNFLSYVLSKRRRVF